MKRNVLDCKDANVSTTEQRLLQALVVVGKTHQSIDVRPIDEEKRDFKETAIYCLLSREEKIQLELESLGLVLNPKNRFPSVPTPIEFINSLKELVGCKFNDSSILLTQIKDKSILFNCPFSCIDSNLNRKNVNMHYLKFACKFHTKKSCNCNSSFIVYINCNVVDSISFTKTFHNHPLDALFVGSKVTLLTSKQKLEMKNAASKGLPTSYIRTSYGSDLLPNQIYNIIRKEKNLFSIMKSKNYTNIYKKLKMIMTIFGRRTVIRNSIV